MNEINFKYDINKMLSKFLMKFLNTFNHIPIIIIKYNCIEKCEEGLLSFHGQHFIHKIHPTEYKIKFKDSKLKKIFLYKVLNTDCINDIKKFKTKRSCPENTSIKYDCYTFSKDIFNERYKTIVNKTITRFVTEFYTIRNPISIKDDNLYFNLYICKFFYYRI